MIRTLIVIFVTMFLSNSVIAQEFNVSVQVSSQQIEGTEKKLYQTMQKSVREFVNDRKWSPFKFKNEERIEGTMLITLVERNNDVFRGKLNVVLRRPVYNTGYHTTLLNYVDKDFKFEYVEFQPLEFDESTFNSNLTSVLAYYCYIFLGLDFDTFSLYGGNPFFEKAQNIVNNAQNTSYQGWKAFESHKNRYWLIENLMNTSYRPVREFLYQYHRKGLDMMSEKTDIARTNITESLELLKEANQEEPGLFILQLLIEAKRDEFVNIYSEGPRMDKSKAINILKEIDPSNSSKYQKIMTGN
ncbi:MAG: DUF4835 family protein [Bacteroidales bacterium]|nr:DUF4835 family protein [Bacteroidales bacterium]